MTALLNLDEIVGRIVNTVMSALHVSSVALYLDDSNGTYYALAAVGPAADRLSSVRPQRDNSVVALIARQRQGVSRYDLEANPLLAQIAPKALAEFDVVISGRKRFHGAARANLDYVSIADDRLKVEPLAGFSALDIQSYMNSHHLPSHPLKLRGYRSIGCEPCTSLGGTDDDPRAGRWAGTDKTECGIHFTANGQIIRTVQRQAVNA